MADTSSLEQQIKDIEDEIFNTQKNKATEHHIGKLKAKIARLKLDVEKRSSQGSKGKGFSVKKQGDATVGLVGFPSIGKSTLLTSLTNAKSEIAAYEFTTLDTIPGMMKYKGANIQILDLPGLILGAAGGKGRGREVLSVVRNVDLVLFMVDAQHDHHLKDMADELQKSGLRLNQRPPDVVVKKGVQGGIQVTSTVNLTNLDEDIVKSIAGEYMHNGLITIRENITIDQLIDVFVENRVYVPALVIINKADLVSKSKLKKQMDSIKRFGWKVVPISAKTGKNLDSLREEIFSALQFIRIYMKPVGEPADLDEPLILKDGDTVETAARKIHRDFKRQFRYATVSGPSAKHEVQKVGLDHRLKDQDILTLVVWKE